MCVVCLLAALATRTRGACRLLLLLGLLWAAQSRMLGLMALLLLHSRALLDTASGLHATSVCVSILRCREARVCAVTCYACCAHRETRSSIAAWPLVVFADAGFGTITTLASVAEVCFLERHCTCAGLHRLAVMFECAAYSGVEESG
jgi:hypothetical protein